MFGIVRGTIKLVVIAVLVMVGLNWAEENGFQMPDSISDLQHPERLLAGTPFAARDDATPDSDPHNHTFIAPDSSGTPARYNPCAPVRYTVNLSRAPEGALADVHEAFERISAATGIRFEYVGETTLVPTSSWSATGAPYRPIGIAWVRPGESDLLSGNASGNGGSDWVTSNGRRVFVTGSVVLNADHNDLYESGFGDGLTRGNLLVHELGHVVGLGHADTPGAVMHGSISEHTPGEFSAGDLAGLSAVGAGAGCL